MHFGQTFNGAKELSRQGGIFFSVQKFLSNLCQNFCTISKLGSVLIKLYTKLVFNIEKYMF